MGTLGENIVKLAGGQVFPLVLGKDPKTGEPKLVPGNPVNLSDDHFVKAARWISSLVGGGAEKRNASTGAWEPGMNPLIQSLYDFGKFAKDGGGWFSDGYITTGIEKLAAMTSIFGNLGENIFKLAAGTIVVNDLVTDPKTGEKKLAPVRVRPLFYADFVKAGAFIKKLVAAGPKDANGDNTMNPLVS